MLTSSGFGNDAFLAHAFGEKNLSEAVVDLVCPGLSCSFVFEIDSRPAQFLAEIVAEEERCGPPGVGFLAVP